MNTEEPIPELSQIQYKRAPKAKRSAAQPIDEQLKAYLLEIGRTALLTLEEEQALGSAIERGRKAEEKLVETVTPEENRQLEAEVRMGELAKRRLVESNLRLVVSIAKRYVGHGLSLSDVIQEGNIGLMRAAEKFDWRRGLRFSTYATWWVRHSITRAIAEQGRLIRLPVHVTESMGKVQRTHYQLLQELGREPSMAEIAARVNMPEQRVEEILTSFPEPVSLDVPVTDEEATTLGELLAADEGDLSPSDAASRQMLKGELSSYLEFLTTQERQVLELRFGLKDGRQRTLEQVGAVMGLTRERIRQIEGKALRRLRSPATVQRFGAYLE
ncbi:MAG: sigma-70 family RNA polymerase sigma factor [Chloroflexi bacterium]|nr:sigma-70 family RNA polymerase sigma factor [Chloroflexota bacterium]